MKWFGSMTMVFVSLLLVPTMSAAADAASSFHHLENRWAYQSDLLYRTLAVRSSEKIAATNDASMKQRATDFEQRVLTTWSGSYVFEVTGFVNQDVCFQESGDRAQRKSQLMSELGYSEQERQDMVSAFNRKIGREMIC